MGNIEPGPIRQRGLLRPISQSGSDPEKITLIGSEPGRAADPHRIIGDHDRKTAADDPEQKTAQDEDQAPRTDSTDGDQDEPPDASRPDGKRTKGR